MVGQVLGHYRILDKIGAGGMGEVYRAEDSTLDRQVALKVLPAEFAESRERLDRFRREAKALAALDHPNIVSIHTVEESGGVHFLTMQLVEGEQLSRVIPDDGLPLEPLLDIAIPLSDALFSAHRKGVVHRDLKPENIMVTEEGRVMVLDFGLAKLRPDLERAADASTVTEPLTGEGHVPGTIPYMSPEQIVGKDVDHRTDIFSLGSILYRLATGENPFKGDSLLAVVSSIVKYDPRPVDEVKRDLPHDLGQIIGRCLEKDRERRFQSAQEVHTELEDLHRKASLPAGAEVTLESEPNPNLVGWRLVAAAMAGAAIVLAVLSVLWLSRSQPNTAPPSGSQSGFAADVEADPPKIIVLPFENLGAPEDDYFTDGITEEITSRLAAASGLRVISRSSAMEYKDDRPSSGQLGEELGVDYILEGTVRWGKTEDGSRVRITPQLIQVADDTHLWADTYDRVIDDIFEVQSDIASEVIGALGVTLRGDEQAALEDIPTENVEAYQAYLQALNLRQFGRSIDEADTLAVEAFERAVELDPGFAEAWAELSRHHSSAFHGGWDTTEERLARAKFALQKAEAVDPEAPITQLARGYYYYYGFKDYDRALEEFQVLAEHKPNDPEVIAAIAYLHRRRGRLGDTIRLLEQAIEIDPQNVGLWSNLAGTYRSRRETAKTLAAHDRVIALKPDNDQSYLAKVEDVFSLTGDLEAARAILEQAPGTTDMQIRFGWINQFFRERDYDRVIEVAETLDIDHPFAGSRRETFLAIAKVLRDGKEGAQPDVEAALIRVNQAIGLAPESENLRRFSSVLYAFLGDEVAALHEANVAIDLTAMDAYAGPSAAENLAAVYVILGRHEEALDIIEDLLDREYQAALTVHTLKHASAWDPLRSLPRFQALLEKHGQEAG